MLDLFNGVVSIQKNSFIDFPGRASALLFYGGCNLNCPYCHNATLLRGKTEPDISHDEMKAFLKKRVKFLDGVVISGGEPTLHKGMPALVSYLKDELSYEIKLDSNGLKPKVLRETNWDYLALDIKTTFDNYSNLLGANGDVSEEIVQSLQIVKEAGENAEVRITCAPGIVNSSVIQKLVPLLDGVKNVFLQPFKYSDTLIDPKFFVGKNHITDEDLSEFQTMIGEVVGRCEVRGR